MIDTRLENAQLRFTLLRTSVINRLASIAVQIWISMAFSLSPRKYFNGKFNPFWNSETLEDIQEKIKTVMSIRVNPNN